MYTTKFLKINFNSCSIIFRNDAKYKHLDIQTLLVVSLTCYFKIICTNPTNFSWIALVSSGPSSCFARQNRIKSCQVNMYVYVTSHCQQTESRLSCKQTSFIRKKIQCDFRFHIRHEGGNDAFQRDGATRKSAPFYTWGNTNNSCLWLALQSNLQAFEYIHASPLHFSTYAKHQVVKNFYFHSDNKMICFISCMIL